jgi:hypothetical protein
MCLPLQENYRFIQPVSIASGAEKLHHPSDSESSRFAELQDLEIVMKRILTVTCLLAGACMMMSLKSTVHAQDRQERKARAQSQEKRYELQVPLTDARDSAESKVQRGFDAAPVPLNLDGKDLGLAGLGSYIVNLQSGCNGCHSAGPTTEYAPGGNPYFGQPQVINPAVYLGGGDDFGALIPGTANIVSRNLTPDKTGMPVGGATFDEFLHILRTGEDMDKLHPNCTGAPNSGCLLPPFKGDLLQIMPWPTIQTMSDHEIRAIYEYLKAIPCISGPPAPSPLHNDCN